MSAVCRKCRTTIEDFNWVICCTGDCHQLYHIHCTELISSSVQYIRCRRPTWVCRMCILLESKLSQSNFNSNLRLKFQNVLPRIQEENTNNQGVVKHSLTSKKNNLYFSNETPNESQRIGNCGSVDNDLIPLLTRMQFDLSSVRKANDLLVREHTELKGKLIGLEDRFVEFGNSTKRTNMQITKFLETMNKNTLDIFHEMFTSTKKFNDILEDPSYEKLCPETKTTYTQTKVDEILKRAQELEIYAAQVNILNLKKNIYILSLI